MKTKLTKLMSLLMAAAVVLSLAACGGTGDEPDTSGAAQGNAEPNASETVAPADDESTDPSESNTNPDATEPTDGADDSTKPGDKTEATDPTKPTDKPQKPDGNDAKAPSGVNGIVSYYNAAVKKISKVSSKYTRKITSGSVTGGVNLNLTEQKYADSINRNNVALTGNDAALKALSAADVSNATCKESGSNYVLTISLKPKSGKDNAIKVGAGGYMFFAEMDEINTAVGGIGEVLGVKGITVKTATLSLSGGKLTVTANKSSGKISKATLTFTENVDAKAEYLFLKPAAKLSVNFTVNYTAS